MCQQVLCDFLHWLNLEALIPLSSFDMCPKEVLASNSVVSLSGYLAFETRRPVLYLNGIWRHLLICSVDANLLITQHCQYVYH